VEIERFIEQKEGSEFWFLLCGGEDILRVTKHTLIRRCILCVYVRLLITHYALEVLRVCETMQTCVTEYTFWPARLRLNTVTQQIESMMLLSIYIYTHIMCA
jgi:hypothetical protein